MLNRSGHQIEFECDNCGSCSKAYDSEDFDVLLQESKDLGWRVRKNAAGGWEHYCPNC